jgi:hypothetical protein
MVLSTYEFTIYNPERGPLSDSSTAPGASQVLVRSMDYEVEFDGCGVWVYMGER